MGKYRVIQRGKFGGYPAFPGDVIEDPYRAEQLVASGFIMAVRDDEQVTASLRRFENREKKRTEEKEADRLQDEALTTPPIPLDETGAEIEPARDLTETGEPAEVVPNEDPRSAPVGGPGSMSDGTGRESPNEPNDPETGEQFTGGKPLAEEEHDSSGRESPNEPDDPETQEQFTGGKPLAEEHQDTSGGRESPNEPDDPETQPQFTGEKPLVEEESPNAPAGNSAEGASGDSSRSGSSSGSTSHSAGTSHKAGGAPGKAKK